jgi:hypothetical protein
VSLYEGSIHKGHPYQKPILIWDFGEATGDPWTNQRQGQEDQGKGDRKGSSKKSVSYRNCVVGFIAKRSIARDA